VVRPGRAAEVQACVATPAAEGHALVASGLGAHLDVGAVPRRLDVLLRLDRLAGIVDHQPGDMTITAEAGCALPVLDATLAGAGQWLPIDPPAPGRTTVGGLLAANLSGPLRASQGTARDLVIGVRTVGADGALVAGGGRVVKNVAGYDLPKLHIGALGTVGVIVEVTFKVRPRPEREEAVVVACPSFAAAADVAAAVRDGDAAALWIEIAGPGAVAEAPGDGAAVAVGLAGVGEEVAYGRELLRRLAAERGVPAVVVDDGRALRGRLAAFPLTGGACVLRLSTLVTGVGEALELAASAARDAGTAIRLAAHAGSGVARIVVAEAAAVAPLVRHLRAHLAASDGHVIVERARPAVKASLPRDTDVWGDPGPAFALARRLKETFDPQAIFAPGRFVGGL
jgi:glycolate oxidase FAD binding subunit